ncbi:hypothetical protein Fot_32749 [Forsythia ovata]|uniref:Uncharacterized protein n=1 Tax=Forsythia ovata TaxID=205694 RepID=A0ABD1T8P4_9LAMI
MDCGDSDLEEIGGMAPGEIVVMVNLLGPSQREESVRQRKGKWIAGPSGVVESGDDGESISPKTYRVNLGLDPKEMNLVEGWVEHVRELSRGHEDPDSDPDSWACNQYHSDLSFADFTKLKDLYMVSEEPLKQTAMCILGLSSLPKIGLAGIAAKKIPLVAKKNFSGNDQKRILVGLSLKGGEKDQDAPPASFDPR